MKAEQERYERTLNERWALQVSGAPEFDFGWAGRTVPHSAVVEQATRSLGQSTLSITLVATAPRNGWSVSRAWVAPAPAKATRASWEGDPPGSIDDLPTELVSTILTACGGITLPEPKGSTP